MSKILKQHKNNVETDQGKNVKSQSKAIMLMRHLVMWFGFCHLSALPGATGSPSTDNQHNKQLPQRTVGEPQVVRMNGHALAGDQQTTHSALHCILVCFQSEICHVFFLFF